MARMKSLSFERVFVHADAFGLQQVLELGHHLVADDEVRLDGFPLRWVSAS
jgi:hypothetical protein